MRRFLVLCVVLALPTTGGLWAQGHGGMGGQMMGGSGSVVVADDGSLLLNEMDQGGMMGGGELLRELVNISADGEERWRVSFEDGWPMMPVTEGDLVVVVLVDDWFVVGDGSGDWGWGDGHGGGGPGTGEAGEAAIVALDLATGVERWRTDVTGAMASMTQFSPDGSRLYVTVRGSSSMGGGHGDDPIRQGDASDGRFLMSTTIAAFDRQGHELWTYDSSSGGMGGGPVVEGGV